MFSTKIALNLPEKIEKMTIILGKRIFKKGWLPPIQWKSFLVLPAYLLIMLSAIPTHAKNLNQFKYISLGFASQDLSAPVSLFGHTFLIFSDQFPPEPSAESVEFMGKIDVNSGFFTDALLGQLPGEISKKPLAQKELEYDREDRDLHYFELQLDQNERIKLSEIVDREINTHQSDYRYGFFRENCSFKVYKWVLEATNNPLPMTIAHVPLRGLKSLDEQGLIKTPQSKSSLARNLNYQISKLSNHELNYLKFFQNGGDLLPNASVGLKSAVQNYAAYRIHREPLKDERNRLQKAITPHRQQDHLEIESPLKNFYSDWVNISIHSELFRLGYSPSIKNHFNILKDSLKNSFLEMGRMEFLFNKNSILIDKINLIELDTLPDLDHTRFQPSRYFKLGYDYHRGIEFLFGLGLPVHFPIMDFTIMPLIGFKTLGFQNKSSLSQATYPQIGYRVRFDSWLLDNLVIRNTITNFLIHSMNPELRFESEIVLRFKNLSPFIGFRRILNMRTSTNISDLDFGLAIGI